MSVLDAALEAMERGWAVFPVSGKVPCTARGVHDASTEERLAHIWYERHPDRGLALATGHPSGVWALDLDGPEGVEALVELQEDHGRLPVTVTSRTRSGFHLLFRMPEEGDVRNSASKVAEGIDVRGTGGYVVLPPSPHPAGVRYRWVRSRSPNQCRIRPAPGWLLEQVIEEKRDGPVALGDVLSGGGADLPEPGPDRARYVQVAILRECDELARTPEGQRNDRLNTAAFKLARFVASGDAAAEPVVRALAHAASRTGLPDSEIEKTLESAFRARGVA